MTALAKLTEAVEHAYKKRTETENKYLECLPEIGPCNMRQDNTFIQNEEINSGILSCNISKY